MNPLAFERTVCELSAQSTPQLAAFYEKDAIFKDPFHEIRGRTRIEGAYRSMFLALYEPHFKNLIFAQSAQNPALWAVRWNFSFRTKPGGELMSIPGTSWLTVNQETGLIALHEDHWDASAFFGSFSGLSWAVKALKNKVSRASHVTEKS
ncbi:MAG: nuclear transport factor 2 family protein [Betaproteobacteria bacterium]|nr:nuclear transport factor 2 family protein [Betaproteobacteria bacterium]NBT74962.1 nuclear transport factor 2 family protein [Betaproteobacteria bacterium]NBY14252.1 nuclear transport factor 2 family protein [Betaproteobacteria bacterium]NCA15693.1 nuclear transport factor 2 family protein [Betaproteobacteria bacterium]NDF04601.1 nuclear transport factor 2 family protein [Betaproteobacteria bacterium]